MAHTSDIPVYFPVIPGPLYFTLHAMLLQSHNLAHVLRRVMNVGMSQMVDNQRD